MLGDLHPGRREFLRGLFSSLAGISTVSSARGVKLSTIDGPQLRLSSPAPARVPRLRPMEIDLDLKAAYENAFDPEQIDVWADFRNPKGEQVRVNAFFHRSYSRRLEGRRETLATSEPALWKLRFTPELAGKWEYQLHARDRNGVTSLAAATLSVVSSAEPGFIRRSQRNPAVFALEKEKPYFLVGENMCWGGWNGQRGSYDYDEWLPALAKAGGNWIRIWMSSWNCALEWSPDPDTGNGEFKGVGRYNLAHAWKLDFILDLCEKHWISVMLCFGTYGEFNEGGFFNEGQWKLNPYNSANGGPCAKPGDFWTDESARKLYRRRLRYIVARYAHRSSIHSWEFWNEAQAPAAWVTEMARYLKSVDPYDHLVTTTYGTKDVWQIPEIDVTQTHHYGKGDIADSAPVIRDDAAAHARFGKPHLMAEFGIDWRKGDENYDSEGEGINLHNGIWASIAAGNAGTAMIWWWDGYVHPKNLYRHFTPIRRFVDRVPWTSGPWKPLVRESPSTDVLVVGQTDGRHAVIWIQNSAFNWKNHFEKKPIPPTSAAELAVREIRSGNYTVEWWDTWSGNVSRTESCRVTDGTLRLKIPPVARDVAIRVAPA